MNFNGADVLTVTTKDGVFTVIDNTTDITVTPVNDAPVIAGDLAATVLEGGSYQLTTADLGEADPDDSGTGLTYTVSALSNGVIKVNGTTQTTFTAQDVSDGLVVFDHDGSETTTAGFNVSLADGLEDGAVADTDSFSFTVTPVNDAPVIAVDGAANYTTGGAAVAIDASVTITDVDNANLTGAVIAITSNFSSGDTLNFTNQLGITGSYNSSTGQLTLSGSASKVDYETAIESITFSTTSGSALTRTVSYTVNDGTVASAADTATVNVTAGNLAPTDIALKVTVAAPAATLPGVGTFATLSTVDPDDPLGAGSYIYTLLAGSSAAFSISGSTLSIAAALADNTTYTLNIQSNDGAGGLYSETFNVITGSLASNTLPTGGIGDAGDDVIYGLGNQDMMFGGTGHDQLFGQDGSDDLFGGDGNDELFGGAGNDKLFGNAGNDRLTGGAGADEFQWNSASEFGDTILDFSSIDDTLVFDVGNTGSQISIGNNDTGPGGVDGYVEDASSVTAGMNVAGNEVVVQFNEILDGGDTGTDTNAEVQAAIDGYNNITTGALFVFDVGAKAEVWYDANPSAVGGAVLVAELTNINTISGATFASTDFVFV